MPSQFDNFTGVVEKLRVYKDQHYWYITVVFCSVYLYKQTFAIPGSFFLVSPGSCWRGLVLKSSPF